MPDQPGIVRGYTKLDRRDHPTGDARPSDRPGGPGRQRLPGGSGLPDRVS